MWKYFWIILCLKFYFCYSCFLRDNLKSIPGVRYINSSDYAVAVYKPDRSSNEQIVIIEHKLGYQNFRMRSNGCQCTDLRCGCCFGMNINQFNFNREGCMNFTYYPYDFALGVNMMWNEQSLFNREFSGKNPPPFCVPVPNPLPIPFLPQLEFCAKFFDVYTPGRNLHMCFDMETRIQRMPILVLHFNCMRFGADGIAMLKPEDMGGLGGSGQPGEPEGGYPEDAPPNIGPSSTTDVPQIDSDVYDPITEIIKTRPKRSFSFFDWF